MQDISQHRAAIEPRSGDTHVIGEDGKAVNVDRQARDAEAKARSAADARAPARAKKAD